MSYAITRFNRRLGKVLSRHRLVEDEAIEDAIQEVGENGSVTKVLVESGTLEENE